MQILLLFGCFLSLFLFLLLLTKKAKVPSDKYLLSIFFVYSITIGGAYIELYNIENNFPLPHLLNVSWLFLLLHGPMLWFYVQSLIKPHFQLRLLHLLHLLPFVVFCAIQWSDFLMLPAAQKIYLVQHELFRQFPIFKISVAAIGVSSLTYNIWALSLLAKHLRNIKNEYSNIEAIDLQWLKVLVVASLVIFTVNVLIFNLNNILNFASYYQISNIAFVFASFYVLFLGFFGIRQGHVFSENNPPYATQQHELNEQPTALPSSEPLFDNAEYAKVVTQLTLIMECEKAYLDPELTLAKLSKMLKLKPDLVSNVLNQCLQQNFFDYINKLRIEEFKLLCMKPENKHLSILGIAYDSGFNSKAAFYRAFKKFEGVSPSAFMAGR